MDKLSPLLAEWGSMKFLISEILLCLLAASILGLIIGWLCRGAFARDKHKHREAAWQRKYAEQEDNYTTQLRNSEQQVSGLQTRLDSAETEKSALHTSLESNKSAVHKAHIEVQQLSKRQRDTQERLQKIISEKDREISRLQQETGSGKNTPPRPLGFSSRKPANPEPPTSAPPPRSQAPASPAAPRSTPAPPSRPTTSQPQRPQQPEPVTRSTAGGRPNLQSVDPGYKPGTQTTQDDFDKTQVLRSDAEQTSTSPMDRTSAPGSNQSAPSDLTSATADYGTAAPRTESRPPSSQNPENINPPRSTSQQGPEVRTESTGGRSMGRKKSSLWDRVKSSVTKKDN